MKNTSGITAAALCIGLSIGCGGGERAAESTVAGQGYTDAAPRPEPVSVTGCLTSADGRFALTELDEGGTTQTYQLAGADDQLRAHVGREVSIAGEAEAAQVADVRESTTPGDASGQPIGTSGQAEPGDDASVRTEAHTRLETRTLMVSSVTPTGDECPAGQAPGGRQ